VAESLIDRARYLILEDLRRHSDLDFVLRWHVQREDPNVDNDTYRAALAALEDDREIITYWNPAHWWDRDHGVLFGPGDRYRLPSRDDQLPLPPGAEWRAGAPFGSK
jgi:hypothetical protein